MSNFKEEINSKQLDFNEQITKKLKFLLSKQSNIRSNFELKEIQKSLANIKFIGDFINNPNFLELCRYMQVVTYGSHVTIFEQNQFGDEFYIILKGQVTVHVDNEQKSRIEIQKLKAGASFGELTLLHESKRTSTIITDDIENDFIVINKQLFQKYIMNGEDTITPLIQFFSQMDFFHDKNISALIASRCTIRKFPINYVLSKQDFLAENIYFIKLGLAKFYKKIYFKTGHNNEILMNDAKDPILMDYQRGSIKELHFEIDEISEGQCYGIKETLNSEKWSITSVTATLCHIVILTKIDLISLINLDNNIKDQLLKLQVQYPNDEMLRQKYQDEQKWALHQKNVVQQIKKQNKNLKIRDKDIKGMNTRGIIEKINEMDILKQLNSKLQIPPKIDIEDQIIDIKRKLLFSPRTRKEYDEGVRLKQEYEQQMREEQQQKQREKYLSRYERKILENERELQNDQNTQIPQLNYVNSSKKKMSVSSIKRAKFLNQNVGKNSLIHTGKVVIENPIYNPYIEQIKPLPKTDLKDDNSILTTQEMLNEQYNSCVAQAIEIFQNIANQAKTEQIANANQISEKMKVKKEELKKNQIEAEQKQLLQKKYKIKEYIEILHD